MKVASIESSGRNGNLSNRYRMLGRRSKGVDVSTPDAPGSSGLRTPVTPDAPQVSMGVGEGQAEEGTASEVRQRICGGGGGSNDVVGRGELVHGLAEAVEGEEEQAGVVPVDDLQQSVYSCPFVVFVFTFVGVVGSSGVGRGILHRSFRSTPLEGSEAKRAMVITGTVGGSVLGGGNTSSRSVYYTG